jgi:putative spermidine/putrescine transport system permease protein
VAQRTRIILLLAPAVLLLGGLFLSGIGLGLLRSLRYMPVIGLTEPLLSSLPRGSWPRFGCRSGSLGRRP